MAITGISHGVRGRAKKLGVTYEFLFMRASGDQLREIARLVDEGALRPVVGKVWPFDQTAGGLAALGKGGICGKAVISGR